LYRVLSRLGGLRSARNWELARQHFTESLAVSESPEALEGLGWAGYFLDDEGLTLDARERASSPTSPAGRRRLAGKGGIVVGGRFRSSSAEKRR
jgi:hypothetical protein